LAEVQTVDAKYVFLDVVGFTRGRSVEAQSDIVETLNEIVDTLLHEYGLSPNERILLPTGDGICVAILKRDPYDLHVQLALSILEGLRKHNINTEDEKRQFQVRIGINFNTDNLVTDINGNQNVAGAGINGAQRVMDSADGNQILVSHAVHETLRHRERYMEAFRSYMARTKHDERVPVHQLLIKDAPGLNLDEPQAFVIQKKKQPKLTEYVAYYLAHAVANHRVLLENKDTIYSDEAVVTLLHFLAKDSEKQSSTTELETFYPETYKAGSATFWEQYEYYSKLVHRGANNPSVQNT
jgi:class 3 adenylate cyclase